MYTSFEDAIYQVYQRLLILFQAKGSTKGSTIDNLEDRELAHAYTIHHDEDGIATAVETDDSSDESSSDSDSDDGSRESPSQADCHRRRKEGGKLLLESLHGTTEPTQQMKNIIYYVTGAALFATLRFCDAMPAGEERKRRLLTKLSYEGGEAEAKREDMPCRLISTRQKRTLLFPSKALFELTLEMEKDILIPLLSHDRILACLGNSMAGYLERQIAIADFPWRFMNIFEKALGMKESEDQEEEDEYLPRMLASRFYRYYIGSSFNDLISHKARVLRHDRDQTRNIAFRIKVLSKHLMKKK